MMSAWKKIASEKIKFKIFLNFARRIANAAQKI